MSRAGAAVTLDGVTRRFRSVPAVEDVSFAIHPGEVLGLLGPNGAGKTTTMRVLTGYLHPSAGRVRVGDVDAARDPVGARQLIGYMPESAPVPPEMSVTGYLRFCARLRRVPRTDQRGAVGRVIGQAGLQRVAGQRIGSLSKGYRQRVALAQALVHDPPVLVLDEPTAGLDPRQVVETRELIARLGRSRTVLLSSHLLSEVSQLCRRVAVLDRGRLVAVDEVRALTASKGTRIELRVTGDLERARAAVAAVAGVMRAEVRGDVVVLQGDGNDLASSVSRAVVAAGLGLVELRTSTSGTLEEAYLRLVRE